MASNNFFGIIAIASWILMVWNAKLVFGLLTSGTVQVLYKHVWGVWGVQDMTRNAYIVYAM